MGNENKFSLDSGYHPYCNNFLRCDRRRRSLSTWVVFGLLVWSTLTSHVLGQFSSNNPSLIDRGHWSDSRVVFMTDGGTASFVDLGGRVYLIACAHRTEMSSVPVGSRIRYVCYDGSQGIATAIAVDPINLTVDPLHDAAIYTIDHQPPGKSFKISNRPLQSGERVWVCGFPQDYPGFCSRYTTVISDNGTLFLNGKSTPGESGGPIINTDGDFVGTLTGNDGQVTICCGRGPHIQLCQRFCGQCSGGAYQSYCPNGQCSSGNCQNGTCQYQQQPVSVYQQSSQQAGQPVQSYVTNQQLAVVHQNMVTLQNQVSSLQKSVTANSLTEGAGCTCADKWTSLETWKTDTSNQITAIKQSISDLKSTGNKNYSTEIDSLTQQINGLQNQISALQKCCDPTPKVPPTIPPPSPPPTTTSTLPAVPPLQLEGVIKRVQQ